MKEIKQGLLHTFYIFSHPFDGFWIMKSEKKGNIKSSAILMLLLLLTTSLRTLSSGYIFASKSLADFSIWMLALILIAAVAIYVIANWAVTSLLEGKGSISDIFNMTMYALSPIILINIPILLLSHIFVLDEAMYMSTINTVAIIWSVMLFLIGNLSIHEFSMLKSIFTTLLTIFGMAVIVVIGFLTCNLMQEVFLWVVAVFYELVARF